MFLVLLETSGNQNFIFSTNKLRENVGASELTYLVGTKWLLEIVEELRQNPGQDLDFSNEALRQYLGDPSRNPPIEANSTSVEIVIAASGKALLLARDEPTAQRIIRQATHKTQKHALGVDLCGVYCEFEWGKKGGIGGAIPTIYKRFEEHRTRIPSPQLRFLRLPIVRECSTSGFPASYLSKTPDGSHSPLSAVSACKRGSSQAALQRMGNIIPDGSQHRLARSVNELEQRFGAEALDWLAVVHADGNGLGEVFLNFQQHLQDRSDDREYIDKLRRFSIALDTCTENAFRSALEVFPADAQTGILPVVPIVLGGDDLTVICDGHRGLEFTQKFLQAFESQTQRQDIQGGIVPKILQHGSGADRLSACAGVAIIKPHFPFSAAYELAETAIEQAKRVKTQLRYNGRPLPCSALDFHVLRDASSFDLEAIREHLTADGGSTKLYNRPYVVTDPAQLAGAAGEAWAHFHHWSSFCQRVQFIQNSRQESGQDALGGELPIGQINTLRASAYWGRDYAESQYRQIRQRYDPDLLQAALEKGSNGTLFAPEPDAEGTYAAEFLDALEATEFLSSSAGS
jgi:hypothetical protein